MNRRRATCEKILRFFPFFFFYQYCHRVFIFVRNCSPVRINSSRPKRSATITLGKCTGRFYNLWFPNDRLVFCTAVLTLVCQLLLHRPALFTFVARLKYWYFSSLYIIYISHMVYILLFKLYCSMISINNNKNSLLFIEHWVHFVSFFFFFCLFVCNRIKYTNVVY